MERKNSKIDKKSRSRRELLDSKSKQIKREEMGGRGLVLQNK